MENKSIEVDLEGALDALDAGDFGMFMECFGDEDPLDYIDQLI